MSVACSVFCTVFFSDSHHHYNIQYTIYIIYGTDKVFSFSVHIICIHLIIKHDLKLAFAV